MSSPLEGNVRLCEPPPDEWEAAALQNRETAGACGIIAADERQALRARLFRDASAYTARLGLHGNSAPPAPGERELDPLFFGAGHQPVIPHLGLIMKTKMLERQAGARGVGINVIVDVDAGEGGLFRYPKRTGSGRVERQWGNIAAGAQLFLGQRLLDQASLAKELGRAAEALRELGLENAAANVERAMPWYIERAGRPIAEASAAARRLWENSRRYLDIPLSQILGYPEVQAFFGRLLEKFEALHDTYNRVLDNYRAQRGIDNPANPFPDLRSSDGWVELPFWLVDAEKGERGALYAARRGRALEWRMEERPAALIPEEDILFYERHLEPGLVLAPRAMTLSLLLRFCLFDLFIHGTGGARYDACTDEFIEAYFGCRPPRIAAASATERLFTGQIAAYERARSLADKKREIYFHISKYLNAEFFSPEARRELAAYAGEKQRLVGLIKAGKSAGSSTKEATRAVKEVEAGIRRVVDRELSGILAPAASVSEDELEVFYDRQYPFFMFDPALPLC